MDTIITSFLSNRNVIQRPPIKCPKNSQENNILQFTEFESSGNINWLVKKFSILLKQNFKKQSPTEFGLLFISSFRFKCQIEVI